ncbi:chemotaxis protein CheW [Pseudomonas sp. B2M1-30]|uniref:chemotaxis protein CheW n=1 Tax=Pseudomonas TaxID=286 RepID=UPI001C3C5524|nr:MULTISPECIES: chemotaxis protein CheW [Pseudomonas]MBV4473603.1 chemotaxis protein CheW [Pseudomonas botevensis]MCU0117743.1 chemotaxis protein CheW [Pseudomonas sp. B2M1-30]MCU7259279.1 chemotaxis protein CheW [Pseudomonas koreensis]
MKGLADKSRVQTPPEGDGQYLTFTSGGEMYAIAILGIKEIIEYGGLTVVPMMPDFVRGVINLRGAVVPVIDLAARFGQPNASLSRRSCVVIVEGHSEAEGRQDIGLLVDAVSAVLDIAASDVEPAPNFGARINAEFISGMARMDGKFVIVLNVDRVLSVDDMAVIGTACAPAHPEPA